MYEYAYCVARQNVGLETWTCRQIVTSQIAHTKYKWSPYAIEWIPHENFLRTQLGGPNHCGAEKSQQCHK